MRLTNEVLENHYQKAIQLAKKDSFDDISDEIKANIDIFIENIESDKSLVQVIVTSLIKKSFHLNKIFVYTWQNFKMDIQQECLIQK
jgi:hypothetical protein